VTTKNGKKHRGALMLLGGDITLIAGRYAFASEAELYIADCNIREKSAARYKNKNFGFVDEGCFK